MFCAMWGAVLGFLRRTPLRNGTCKRTGVTPSNGYPEQTGFCGDK
jgi:hypothetical protein